MNIPKIKNACENIKNACENKLSILYPVNPPEDIISRYHQELTYLEHSELLDDFELFRLLLNEASKCSTIITMRGTIMGSLIYYLLGNNCFNPLPAHYYCPKCGHYELVNTHLFGIDLPEKYVQIAEHQYWLMVIMNLLKVYGELMEKNFYHLITIFAQNFYHSPAEYLSVFTRKTKLFLGECLNLMLPTHLPLPIQELSA